MKKIFNRLLPGKNGLRKQSAEFIPITILPDHFPVVMLFSVLSLCSILESLLI